MAETRTFVDFFQRWLISQDHHLQDMLRAIDQSEETENEQHCKELIGRVMAHYQQYFEAKSRVVEEDVFLALSPSWFTSHERLYMWMGDFRPRTAFRLVTNNVLDLTEDQSQRMTMLKAETLEEEIEITEEHAEAQRNMVVLAMIEVLRQRRPRNGTEHNTEPPLERMTALLQPLAERADVLRRKTAVSIMRVLKPSQAVKFLAAGIQLQLALRASGVRRDLQRTA